MRSSSAGSNNDACWKLGKQPLHTRPFSVTHSTTLRYGCPHCSKQTGGLELVLSIDSCGLAGPLRGNKVAQPCGTFGKGPWECLPTLISAVRIGPVGFGKILNDFTMLVLNPSLEVTEGGVR